MQFFCRVRRRHSSGLELDKPKPAATIAPSGFILSHIYIFGPTRTIFRSLWDWSPDPANYEEMVMDRHTPPNDAPSPTSPARRGSASV